MRNRHELFLDDLPTDWDKARIDELGEVVGGSTPSRANPRFWGGDISWVTPGELTGLSTKYLGETREEITEAGLASCGARLLQAESLLVTSRATLGAVALAKAPLATNQGFKSITFDSRCAPSFFYHLFKTLNPELSRRASGTTFLEIPAREFRAISLPVPPLLEQRQIAEILDTVDEAIRKTEQIIAKLQQVKQGLLHDLLTRGIDDNGELRDPVRHPEQFKDSPLGRIPKEWDIGAIGTHCVVHNTLRKPLAVEVREKMRGPYPYYGPTGILDWLNEYRVEGTFVLIGEDGDHFLKFSEWPMTQLVSGQFNVNNHAHILSGVRCRTDWLDTWFRHRDITLHLTRQGAGRFKLNKASLRAIRFGVPSDAEQLELRRRVHALEDASEAEERFLDKLRLLKSGLMEDLLTGRVRVAKLLEQAAE